MKILFINNNDSFAYNLVNFICQLEPEAEIIVVDNHIAVDKVKEMIIGKIIISTGSGHPKYDTETVITIIKEFLFC